MHRSRVLFFSGLAATGISLGCFGYARMYTPESVFQRQKALIEAQFHKDRTDPKTSEEADKLRSKRFESLSTGLTASSPFAGSRLCEFEKRFSESVQNGGTVGGGNLADRTAPAQVHDCSASSRAIVSLKSPSGLTGAILFFSGLAGLVISPKRKKDEIHPGHPPFSKYARPPVEGERIIDISPDAISKWAVQGEQVVVLVRNPDGETFIRNDRITAHTIIPVPNMNKNQDLLSLRERYISLERPTLELSFQRPDGSHYEYTCKIVETEEVASGKDGVKEMRIHALTPEGELFTFIPGNNVSI